VQDLRESRCRGHNSWGTSETWFDRGSVEVVRVFVGRSHPLSFWLHWIDDDDINQNVNSTCVIQHNIDLLM
jgi:hypothetical protein